MNASQAQSRFKKVGEELFGTEVLSAEGPVVVEFSASWSHPCHVLDAVLDDVANACTANVKFVKVDADNCPDLSLYYGIQSIPTLLYFLGGKVHAKIVGTASREAILAKLRAVLPEPLCQPQSHDHDS